MGHPSFTLIRVICCLLTAITAGCLDGKAPLDDAPRPATVPDVSFQGPCDGPALAHVRVDRSKKAPDAGAVIFAAAGDICLRVSTGGENGHAAAAAWITLDTSLLAVSPDDFNGRPAAFNVLVRGLNDGEHRVEVRVASKPGTFVDVEVVGVVDPIDLDPGGDLVTGTVGPAGGVVSSSGGPGLISIPPDALSAPTSITIAKLSDTAAASPLPDGLVLVGGVELLPEGTLFDAPALVLVPLTRRLTPGRPLTALYYDPAQGAWVRSLMSTGEHASAMVTSDGAHAAFLVDHFSSHAVALPELPELDLVQIGTVRSAVHVCPINFDFGVWDGPPINNIFGTAYSDPIFRHGVFTDVFEQVLLRPTVGDGGAHYAIAAQILASARNELASNADLLYSHALLSKHVNRGLRGLWGWYADQPASFKHTTFANVQARFSKLSAALQVVAVGAQLDEGAAQVELLWVLSQAADLTRIEAMKSYLDSIGLSADPAVVAGFEVAADRVEARHDAQLNEFVAAVAKAAEHGVVTVDTLLEAGLTIGLPAVIVDSLVKAKLITQAAGTKLAAAAGLALDLALGNGDAHRRSSTLCALSTLYAYGLERADVVVDGVELAELKYIAFAELARAASSFVEGEELGFTNWLVYLAVDPFVGGQRDATITFWRDASSTAEAGLRALASMKYNLDTEPMQTTVDDELPSVSFACRSDASITKQSCGTEFVGCYAGPQGSWFWTYSVSVPDCTATFTITAPSSGEQPVYAEYFAFCDQSRAVRYGVEDDFKSSQVVIDQWASTLTPRTSLLGTFHFTSGQSYKVHVSDHDPLGYQPTPAACQAAGGAYHINVNIDRVTFTAQAKPAAPVQASDREAIREDGVSILAWPFESKSWRRVEGSPYHACSDATADDWNTTLGGCDTEITMGPMRLRSAISGVIRFAGKSAKDPGRGYQLIIESSRIPGFFVGYAHLAPFDATGMAGQTVAASGELPVVVGDTGTDCAHLHLSAWRRVLDPAARALILDGRSPDGYTCSDSKYAAPFELNQEW
ncbi:hypothetical protein WMF39_04170 [Sorangium sp. So ce1504]|uniref:golvesin C-terminal-like domain-containing protein n=1 Tax=Sorangium sp. So ce1504 TaxID=3133337 RepID=UPI003F6281C4